MIKVSVKTRNDFPKVKRAANTAHFTSIRHASAALRLTAQRSIRTRKKASPPGQPPATRGKKQLKRAIAFELQGKGLGTASLIGPRDSVVGTSGAAHEFGGKYKDEVFPKRPFMGPALSKIQNRLPSYWQASLKA